MKELVIVKALLDVATGLFFAASLFALRLAVKAVIEGGKNTFSLFHNLADRGRIKRADAFVLCTKAIWMTWFGQGAAISKPGMGRVTCNANTYSLAEETKKYRDADPLFYDEMIFALRAVTWGRITMMTAFAAFLCKLAYLILSIWVK